MTSSNVEFTAVKDSGAHQEFTTGSVRDTREGKGRYDLISTIALRRLALHYENGAKKYGDRNWEKGQPLSRYLDSAMRHLCAILHGLTDEDHAAAVMWNMADFIHTQQKVRDGELPETLAVGALIGLLCLLAKAAAVEGENDDIV